MLLSHQQARLYQLVADGIVHMTWAPEVMERPAPVANSRTRCDRVRGMLLGLAIGDALGNTSESMLPLQRKLKYGEMRDYLPNRHSDNRRVGLPSRTILSSLSGYSSTCWSINGSSPKRSPRYFARDVYSGSEARCRLSSRNGGRQGIGAGQRKLSGPPAMAP
jgi:hypothetical protein